jgi:hypothetical protein
MTKPPSIDRAAVMAEARRQHTVMGPLGWSFARCLRHAWAKLKGQAALRGRT